MPIVRRKLFPELDVPGCAVPPTTLRAAEYHILGQVFAQVPARLFQITDNSNVHNPTATQRRPGSLDPLLVNVPINQNVEVGQPRLVVFHNRNERNGRFVFPLQVLPEFRPHLTDVFHRIIALFQILRIQGQGQHPTQTEFFCLGRYALLELPRPSWPAIGTAPGFTMHPVVRSDHFPIHDLGAHHDLVSTRVVSIVLLRIKGRGFHPSFPSVWPEKSRS